mmetsp:Transcript_149236/g.278314  ORF Transcript_149236/g.278314 Transcript_149236/m.278314 type:complete len:512 (+) Transcript_149236:88-1623(+)
MGDGDAVLDEIPLRKFLGCCRSDWGPRELRAVCRKLGLVGVSNVSELLRRVHDGTLNDRLDAAGERRFTSETLDAMVTAAVDVCAPFGNVGVVGAGNCQSANLTPELLTDEEFEELLMGNVPATPSPSTPSAPRSAPPLLTPSGRRAGAGMARNYGASNLNNAGARPPSTSGGSFSPESASLAADSPYGGLSSGRPAAASSQGAGVSRAGAFEFDMFDTDALFHDDEAGSHNSFGRWGPTHHGEFDETVTLRKQICRGLQRVERVAAEAKRRNREVTRCLAEVQADIVRITERMCVARQRRDRRSTYRDPSHDAGSVIGSKAAPQRNAEPHAGSGTGTRARSEGVKAEVPRASPSQRLPRTPGPAYQRRSGSNVLRGAPLRSGGGVGGAAGQSRGAGGEGNHDGTPPPGRPAAEKTPFCARAAQRGFTFGGGAAAAPRAALAAQALDPAQQAQEAVRGQMLSVRTSSEADRRAFVKRLLVKWHPDRNPESIETATAVFQYIQQEKERLLGL